MGLHRRRRGAAGLSAALVLGRARQRTLVVDAGRQSNRSAHGIGLLLGCDRRPPAEFYAAGREELAAYPTAAGDLSGTMPSVANAVSVGATAAAMMVGDCAVRDVAVAR